MRRRLLEREGGGGSVRGSMRISEGGGEGERQGMGCMEVAYLCQSLGQNDGMATDARVAWHGMALLLYDDTQDEWHEMDRLYTYCIPSVVASTMPLSVYATPMCSRLCTMHTIALENHFSRRCTPNPLPRLTI